MVKAGVAAPDALTATEIEQMYTAAIHKVSGTDAAGGYTIIPDYATFDLVQAGAPQTTCAKLVQDDKSDLVLAGQFVNGGDQCVVQQGGTLLQDVAAPEAAYSMSTGTVVTLDQLPQRQPPGSPTTSSPAATSRGRGWEYSPMPSAKMRSPSRTSSFRR
ncbi:hypothetical protein [Microbacterium elymi]|uniref:Uncharacterized protein n=1 Tax=Microbacterium elymi TaxID=2909587 RepID=A0ABY5NHU3_9MICO|nr:hypothetical protein [Microbacterium elymi]UUT34679.1 hypothetical protein L2X98_29815 [Microbacterium elymi]